MSYNGWTNYETWVYNLWMDNDQGTYNHYTGLAQDTYDEAEATQYSTREQVATNELADAMKSEAQENMPEVEGVWADLLGAALGEVNWHEIAEHYIDEVEKREPEEEETSA